MVGGFGARRTGATLCILCLWLLSPLPAHAAQRTTALPAVTSGARPGPDVLYQPPAQVPELSTGGHFNASPLLVSGTDAYRAGEYLYQDFVYDDHGAKAGPPATPRSSPAAQGGSFAQYSGTVTYPVDPPGGTRRYGGNAADLLEFRVTQDSSNIYYRLTLQTMLDPDVFVAGIGIASSDLAGTPFETFPGAGFRQAPGKPALGLKRFLTVNARGVVMWSNPAVAPVAAGSVAVDVTKHQVTVTVPKAVLDPGGHKLTHYVATGLSDGTATGWLQPQPIADSSHPGGCTLPCPGIFNLGFRFDEPVHKVNPDDPYQGATGNWRDDAQANALANGDVSAFGSEIDFSKLGGGYSGVAHDVPLQGRFIDRLLPSHLDLGQGVQDHFPEYLNRVQPYAIYVPSTYSASSPAGFTFALHSLDSAYNQYATYSPNLYPTFGEGNRYSIVATPLARGQDGWYFDEAEYDTFEVWADIASHYALNFDRALITGYSMGGFGAYKLGLEYPDLFARALSVVGPPAYQVWAPPASPVPGGEAKNTTWIAGNAMHVPYMIVEGTSDELVPPPGVQKQADRFHALGLRYDFQLYAAYDHFAFAEADSWTAERNFLDCPGTVRPVDDCASGPTVVHDPDTVDYTVAPALDSPRLGLLHDHAYWVSGLRPRAGLDSAAAPSAHVRFTTMNPSTYDSGPPNFTAKHIDPQYAADTEEFQDWITTVSRPARSNRLVYQMDDTAAATVDMPRAGLDVSQVMTLQGSSGIAARLSLAGAWTGSVPVTITDGLGTRCSLANPANGVLALDVEGAQLWTIGQPCPVPASSGPSAPGPVAQSSQGQTAQARSTGASGTGTTGLAFTGSDTRVGSSASQGVVLASTGAPAAGSVPPGLLLFLLGALLLSLRRLRGRGRTGRGGLGS